MKGEKVRRDRDRKTLCKCFEQYWIYQVLDDFELDINIPILQGKKLRLKEGK